MRPQVATSSGRLLGTHHEGLDIFRGVPYAAPPLGDRRWAAPQPHEGWQGLRDATAPGAASLQADVSGSTGAQLLTFSYPETSEDCLTLDIWAPARREGPLPTMVFIHGGAFVAGSGSQPIYNGAQLARRGNVVVVTVNYRLGLFGWLRQPELGATGNEGVLDQLAALEWVGREIANFGGDPANVTVFGQSAGAASIAAMLAAGRVPFRRAVLQSGAANLIGTIAQADATAATLTAAGALSRAQPAGELNALQNAVTPRRAGAFYRPVADGALVPLDPLAAIAGGSAHGVDLLVGSTEDEFGFFVGRDPRFTDLDEAGLTALVRARLADRSPVPEAAPAALANEAAAAAIAAYRSARAARGADCSPYAVAVAMLSDAEFRVPALRLAEAHRAAGAGSAHAYLFGWRSPLFGGTIGSAHVLELPFLFGTYRHPNVAAFVGDAPGAEELSHAMVDAWAGFARDGGPGWDGYEAPGRLTQCFAAQRALIGDPLGDERSVWMS